MENQQGTEGGGTKSTGLAGIEMGTDDRTEADERNNRNPRPQKRKGWGEG